MGRVNKKVDMEASGAVVYGGRKVWVVCGSSERGRGGREGL